MTGRVPTERHLCSLVSRASGIDPIGSNTPLDGYLLIEWPLPWPKNIYTDALPPSLNALRLRPWARGERIATRLIAPEDGHSRTGHRRVMLLRRPPAP